MRRGDRARGGSFLSGTPVNWSSWLATPTRWGGMGPQFWGRGAETEASESETERAGLKSGAAPEQVCLRLEADASAELDFAARRGYFRDAAEARGVYEA